MSEIVNFHNPMIRTMVLVQVIGFPLAFLIRAALNAFKARKEADAAKSISLTKTAYYVCFALTSISFFFFRPAGVLFLLAGMTLLVWQFVQTRRLYISSTVEQRPSKPISIRSTRLSKRRA